MVNKCAAPNCSVRYPEKKGKTNDGGETCYTTTKVSSFHFPCETKNKELYDRWKNAVPRENWVPTANSVLCEKHFLPTDFKEERLDENKSRKKSKGASLSRTFLKPTAVPSQWPHCPNLLSKTPPQRHPTCNSTRPTSNSQHQTQMAIDTFD